jgi:uracil-DNA glycosylase family 4
MDVTVGLEGVFNIDNDYINCTRCELCAGRQRSSVMSGWGSSSADIVIIGDFPEEEDERHNTYLEGEEGRFLCNLLEMCWPENDAEMDSIRDALDEEYFYRLNAYLNTKIFWTTMVACSPEQDVKPTKNQVEACLSRIERLIYAIDPILVIGLGDLPTKYLFGVGGKVSKNRGMVFDFTITSPYSGRGCRYAGITTYHPKVLLRAGDQCLIDKKTGLTYEAMCDIKRALKIVETFKTLG